jgi:hypothetical protein
MANVPLSMADVGAMLAPTSLFLARRRGAEIGATVEFQQNTER